MSEATFQKIIDKANEAAINVVRLRDELLWFQKDFLSGGSRLYQIQFPYFFKAMMEEMDRHWPSKGDSYHECSVEDLEELLDDAIEAYRKLGKDYPRKASQAVDLANIYAMLYQRLCGI